MGFVQQNGDADFVYTAYITLRNGRRLYARECGKQAFIIPADRSDLKRK